MNSSDNQGEPPRQQNGNDNVVHLPTPGERRKAEKAMARAAHGPMINLPPVTKFTILAILLVHILTDMILAEPEQYWVFSHFGFTPAYYSGVLPFNWPALAGPFTYAFIHGGWAHIILNGLMLMAFGTGVERWIGGKRLFVFFMLCNLMAALTQFVFGPLSESPVIGASGGLSGLFAAVLVMMQQQNGLGAGNRYGIWPFAILWIVISVVFGMIGGPGNSNVAWAAHIGGFLAGFVLLKPVMRMRILD